VTGDESGRGGDDGDGDDDGSAGRSADEVEAEVGDDTDVDEWFIDRHGFFQWLDLRLEDVGAGYAVLRLPYDEKLLNPGTGGTIHGGFAASLIDVSSAFALRTTFEDPMEATMATTDLNVSYLRPARDDLVARAEVIRAGGSIGVAGVEVTSTTPEGEEKVVAVGRTTYRLFR